MTFKIAESFRRFGISDTSTSILAIKVGGDASLIAAHLRKHVEGDPVGFTDGTLTKLCDPGKTRKIYRVDATDVDAGAFVIGSMALKGS